MSTTRKLLNDSSASVTEADKMVEEYDRESANVLYSRNPEGGHHPPMMKEHLEVL